MNTAIDGRLVIIPTGAARIPDKATVKTSHQLEAVEEIHARDTRRLAIQQDKAFFQIQQGFVYAQPLSIALTSTITIHSAMQNIV